MDYLKENCFFLGVNYWASNAGIKMWQKWDSKVIESDFEKLKSAKVSVLRIFPLWSDFQPLKQFVGWCGLPSEIAISDDSSEVMTREEQLGINIDCIYKFDAFCQMAKKYGFKLIVSLITGWMSGRCFFPDAFIGKNVLTDAECIKWEIKFVKYFVERYKDCDAVIAWELGNECNCLAKTVNKAETWVWTNTIVSSIKLIDDKRPVLCGMHSLCEEKNWDIHSQAELCDILTIHPYVLFTGDCDYDKLLSPRAILHTPAEVSAYSDIGKVPCLVEEIGTLNPVVGNNETVAKFITANLFNSWAYNGLGLLWWTAFDQDKFTYNPYELCDCERELGLFTSNDKEKEGVSSYRNFDAFLRNFPYPSLPKRNRDAVCLVSNKDWEDIFGAFMLSKRAGIELFFADKDVEIPDSNLYIVLGPSDANFFRNSKIKELMQKIYYGATVLFSYQDGLFGYFDEFIGCKSNGRYKDYENTEFEIDGQRFCISRNYALDIKPTTATVIINDLKGKPLMTCNKYGKGNVLFFNGSLEKYYCKKCDTLSNGEGLEKIYNFVRNYVDIFTPCKKTDVNTNITVHKLEENKYIIVAINNTENDISEKFSLQYGYKIKKVYYGEIDVNTLKTNIPSGNALVFEIENN